MAAYCRISTIEQKKGLGIAVQIRDVKESARQHGISIDRIYKDEGESGVLENRTQLDKLLRACERKRIGVVIIPSVDRLSRNVRIAENLFDRFAGWSVKVLMADMPHYDPRNRRDVLIRQIREVIAEDSRKEIIERLWKGRQERTRQGKSPGGNVRYGFQRRNKGLVPHRGESEIVRVIFQLADGGLPHGHLAETLNGCGYRRRNGAEWTTRQVRAIVVNRDRYEKGTIRYGEICASNETLVLLRKTEGKAGDSAL